MRAHRHMLRHLKHTTDGESGERKKKRTLRLQAETDDDERNIATVDNQVYSLRTHLLSLARSHCRIVVVLSAASLLVVSPISSAVSLALPLSSVPCFFQPAVGMKVEPSCRNIRAPCSLGDARNYPPLEWNEREMDRNRRKKKGLDVHCCRRALHLNRRDERRRTRQE